MQKKHLFAVSVTILSLAMSACMPAPQVPPQPPADSPTPAQTSSQPAQENSSSSATPSPADPTTTEETLSPDAGHGPDTDPAPSTPAGDPVRNFGKPVSSSNGVYTITPVGGWEATLIESGSGAKTQPNDPDETIELLHPDLDVSGLVLLGSNFDGLGFHDADATWVEEEITVVHVPALDTPAGPGYVTEQIVGNSDVTGEQYFYAAQLVTVREDEDPFLVSLHRPEGINPPMLALTYTPDATGQAALSKIQKFLKSEARKDAVSTLRHIKVNQ